MTPNPASDCSGMNTLPPTWKVLYESINGRNSFGALGVRDPDGICESFDPVENIDWLGLRITAPGTGRCPGDGHYLCKGCREFIG